MTTWAAGGCIAAPGRGCRPRGAYRPAAEWWPWRRNRGRLPAACDPCRLSLARCSAPDRHRPGATRGGFADAQPGSGRGPCSRRGCGCRSATWPSMRRSSASASARDSVSARCRVPAGAGTCGAAGPRRMLPCSMPSAAVAGPSSRSLRCLAVADLVSRPGTSHLAAGHPRTGHGQASGACLTLSAIPAVNLSGHPCRR